MAAVGGVAYMGAKAGSNRAMQHQSAGAQAPTQVAPAPAASTTAAPPAASVDNASDRISQLKQLADLHSSGALTDEEFASEKAKILG